MNIRIESTTNRDSYETQRMEIDGKHELTVRPLCESPEDAIIGRDLVSCWEIANLMKRAYLASKEGQEFNCELVDE